MNQPEISYCGKVPWFDEIGDVYEPCIYTERRGVGRTRGGGLGASFVADVTPARQSAGGYGNRLRLLLPFSRFRVTSSKCPACSVDEW